MGAQSSRCRTPPGRGRQDLCRLGGHDQTLPQATTRGRLRRAKGHPRSACQERSHGTGPLASAVRSFSRRDARRALPEGCWLVSRQAGLGCAGGNAPTTGQERLGVSGRREAMSSEPRAGAVEKQTGRLESFSDGVFAVAITLLVFNLQVPQGATSVSALGRALLQHWPSYLTFMTSFATILIMWASHHGIFKLIYKADTPFLFANGLLLL